MTKNRIKKGFSFLKKFTKTLRTEMTIPEQRLWTQLRSKRFGGTKFRRQHGIGPYIVDFYCPKYKLVIEIDGESHVGDKPYQRDLDREKYLRGLGLNIVRYHNKDILCTMEVVLENLHEHLTP